MSKQVTLGEQFQKQTFEALALQVPGGHFLIFCINVLFERLHLENSLLLCLLAETLNACVGVT